MIRVVLKLFGPLRDTVGCDEMHLAVAPPYTGTSAFRALAAKSPGINVWQSSIRLAVNLEYVSLNHTLQEGDEVCFIPPVSGG